LSVCIVYIYNYNIYTILHVVLITVCLHGGVLYPSPSLVNNIDGCNVCVCAVGNLYCTNLPCGK